MTESHDNTTCRRATTTDPTVQAVAEAMCPTHREDVPAPLPGHPDPRLRYAACFDCARKAEAAVAAARPLIEREAKAAALVRVRRYAEGHAITAKANGRDDRAWLDLLIILDQIEEGN